MSAALGAAVFRLRELVYRETGVRQHIERAGRRTWLETPRRNAAVDMLTLDWADGVALDFMDVCNRDDLHEMLRQICRQLGCSFYALSHHVDFLGAPGTGLRVHNYPEDWAAWFDHRRLGLTDPVHRASQRTSAGFVWHNVPDMIEVRESDREVFVRAKRHGIGDGLTIPAHVPGDAHGSCSFAWMKGQVADRRALVAAQSISNFAFEAARRIHSPIHLPRPRLTDRQRECLRWAARGKTDWEISKIMSISESVGSSRVDLQACKLEYSIVSPK